MSTESTTPFFIFFRWGKRGFFAMHYLHTLKSRYDGLRMVPVLHFVCWYDTTSSENFSKNLKVSNLDSMLIWLSHFQVIKGKKCWQPLLEQARIKLLAYKKTFCGHFQAFKKVWEGLFLSKMCPSILSYLLTLKISFESTLKVHSPSE